MANSQQRRVAQRAAKSRPGFRARLVSVDRAMHKRFANRFPKALVRLDWLLEWVFSIVTSGAFQVVCALVLVVISFLGVNLIILIAMFSAWLITVLWIARSRFVRALTIGGRLLAIGLFSLLFGSVFYGIGKFGVNEYRRQKTSAATAVSTPIPPPASSPALTPEPEQSTAASLSPTASVSPSVASSPPIVSLPLPSASPSASIAKASPSPPTHGAKYAYFLTEYKPLHKGYNTYTVQASADESFCPYYARLGSLSGQYVRLVIYVVRWYSAKEVMLSVMGGFDRIVEDLKAKMREEGVDMPGLSIGHTIILYVDVPPGTVMPSLPLREASQKGFDFLIERSIGANKPKGREFWGHVRLISFTCYHYGAEQAF